MKIKVILVLIALILSACSSTGNNQSAIPPTATPIVSPTSEAMPTASPTSTVPMIQAGNIQVPDPTVSNPELLDPKGPNISQFVNAMNEVGITVNPQKVIDQLADPQNFKAIQGANEKAYILTTFTTTDQNNTPYTLGLLAKQDTTGQWNWFFETPALRAKISGKDIVVRLGADQQTSKLATKIKMEIGDPYGIYNKSFDWSQITKDWNSNYQQLLQGKVPFADQIFNQNNISRVQSQINYATSHHMTFVGDALFYPNIVNDPMLNNLNPEQKKQVLTFMALAKVTKFPQIKEIDLISELAGFSQWHQEDYNTFNNIGGLNFIHDLAVSVKQLRPDMKLIATEDMIINPNKTSKFQNSYDTFFSILQQIKDNGTPLDEVKFEDDIWVNAPPTEQSISIPLQRVTSLGFNIAGPDTVIATGDKDPSWANWPATKKLVTLNEEPGAQAQILYLLFTTYFKNGAKEIGLQFPTNPDWMGTNGNVFTADGQPTPMFFALISALSQ